MEKLEITINEIKSTVDAINQALTNNEWNGNRGLIARMDSVERKVNSIEDGITSNANFKKHQDDKKELSIKRVSVITSVALVVIGILTVINIFRK